MQKSIRHLFEVGAFITVLTAPGGTAESRIQRSQDAWVGKPPAAFETAALFPSPRQATAVGKRPSDVIDNIPPRSPGLGLRFSTRQWFYVYTDKWAGANHFAPSGWMGDYTDIRFDDAVGTNPADGKSCIQITYLATGSGGNQWAGMYWQEPRNNWGDLPRGINLRGAKRLTFWARGEKGGERISVFKAGGITGAYPDTGVAEIGPVFLSDQWEKYEINLADQDMSKVSGGFAWATGRWDNNGPITFYLDEIRYER